MKVAESEELARKQEKAIVDKELQDAKDTLDDTKKAKLEEVASETDKQANKAAAKKATISDVMKANTEAVLKGEKPSQDGKTATVDAVMKELKSEGQPKVE